jgi:hypothetical protein
VVIVSVSPAVTFSEYTNAFHAILITTTVPSETINRLVLLEHGLYSRRGTNLGFTYNSYKRFRSWTHPCKICGEKGSTGTDLSTSIFPWHIIPPMPHTRFQLNNTHEVKPAKPRNLELFRISGIKRHKSTRHIRKVSTVRLLKKLKCIFKIRYFYQIRHTLNYFST